jgi:hypothetical protein
MQCAAFLIGLQFSDFSGKIDAKSPQNRNIPNTKKALRRRLSLSFRIES